MHCLISKRLPLSSKARRATLMLVALTAVWGMTFPATRAALADTAPMHFLALRFLLAAILLTTAMAGRLRKLGAEGMRSLLRAGWPVGMMLASGFVLQTWGMRWTSASRSGFFTGLLVIFTPLLAAAAGTSRLPKRAWIGVIAALIGVWLLAEPQGGGLNRGDWLTIACAGAFAAQMVSLEAASSRWKDDLTLTWLQLVIVAGLALPAALLTPDDWHITPVGWAALLYNALAGGVLAVLLQTRFQPEVPAGYAAVIFSLEPVFAALFAWALLGEAWTLFGLLGAGLIFMAMIWSAFAVIRQPQGA